MLSPHTIFPVKTLFVGSYLGSSKYFLDGGFEPSRSFHSAGAEAYEMYGPSVLSAVASPWINAWDPLDDMPVGK